MRKSGSRIFCDIDRIHSDPFAAICRNGNPTVFIRNRKLPLDDLTFSISFCKSYSFSMTNPVKCSLIPSLHLACIPVLYRFLQNRWKFSSIAAINSVAVFSGSGSSLQYSATASFAAARSSSAPRLENLLLRTAAIYVSFRASLGLPAS